MANTNATVPMVRCTSCGTEFPASDAAELANHQGHPLEHIEQA